MGDAEASRHRLLPLPVVDYNRCGGASQLRGEFDLDTEAEFVELANIRLGTSPEPKARLIVSGHDGVQFRFRPASRLLTQATLQINESVLLVVMAAELREAAAKGKNFIMLAGKFTRQLSDGRSSDFELRAMVELFRSGPPRANLAFEPAGPIDISNPPVDRNIVLGSLTITPEDSSISVRGRARIVIDADLTLAGASALKASLRAYRLRQDADDRVWQQAERALSEELVLDPVESRFSLHRVDVGMPYAALREWLVLVKGNKTRAPRNVTLELQARLGAWDGDEQTEPLTKLEPSTIPIEVIGLPHESVTFVGLGPPMPMVFPLGNANSNSECRVAPLRLSGLAVARRRLKLSTLPLAIAYDGWSKVDGEVECKLEAGDEQAGSFGHEWTIDPQVPSSQSIEFTVPLPAVLADVDEEMFDRGPVSCRVTVTLRRAAPLGITLTDSFVFDIPVVLEAGPIDWLACVDFGTSSTAVWMGRSGNLAGLSLRLGDWLGQIDPRHDESAWWKEAGSGADEPSYSYLLPSHVGLSSAINLRVDYDPLSFGDLALTGPDDGQKLRLKQLQRSYDVSMPFPSRDLIAQYGDAVVTQPKRRMVGRADHVPLRAEVAELYAGEVRHTRSVNLEHLIGDCFHELGSYISNRALALDLAGPEGRRGDSPPFDERRAKIAASIVEAQLQNSGFGLVVTHPSGISRERLNIYRDAGRRFIDGFCGASPPGQKKAAVMLVAEALAAARFGIQHYVEECKIPETGELRSFITLDIGGGTYDVTVLDTHLTPEGPIDWSVKSHFGLARGGYDMDGALAARVAGILRNAASRSEIASRLEFQPRLPYVTADILQFDDPGVRNTGMRFLSEIQAAKARLTQLLRGPKDEPYRWARGAQRGPAFEVRVGTLGGDPNWPVRLRSNAATPSDQTVWPIPGTGAELAVERTKQGASLKLRLWREAFEKEVHDGDRLNDLIKLMATELPRLAWIDFARRAGANLRRPPIWIVTGRAALWPPLFETIAESIASFGPAAGQLAQPRPFSADEMKHAVVQGAVQLTREPWAEADYAVYNPVAVITYKLRASSTADASPGRAVADIIRVHDDNQPKSQRIIETTEPFVIARILPGLDDEEGREERIELFNRLGIEPWVELEREMPRDTRRGGKTRWTVSTRRDLSGLFLTFDPGDENGSPITFGPLKEGRIYGSE